MKWWSITSGLYKSRATWMVMGGLALVALLAIRISHVQLVRGQSFARQAAANRSYRITIPPERGVLLDRFGQPIILNQRQYWLQDQPDRLFSTRHQIDHATGLAMLATASAQVSTSTVRSYPFGPALVHVTGYVSPVTAEDLAARPFLHPQEWVGRTGLEAVLNARLRGIGGWQEFEINAAGQKQSLKTEQLASPGATLQTTLDPYLSEVARRAMGERTGAVIIADVQTGDVLTLVSTPAFDPNAFTQRAMDPRQEQERQRYIQSVISDAGRRLFNRAISGAYPPGSVFKIVSALAALSTDAVAADTTVIDEGKLVVGTFEFGNWLFRQFGQTDGQVDIVKALQRSNDIYFYKAAEWTGPTALAEYARQLGLGSPVGVGLPSEQRGLIPDPAWKAERLGEQWFLGNTYHMGIGQGDVLVTPIQMAQTTQLVANRGQKCQLHVLMQDRQTCESIAIDVSDLGLVQEGLVKACSAGGTGYPLFPLNQGIDVSVSITDQLAQGAVACKTGTAEFGGTDSRGYRKTHGWMVAYRTWRPTDSSPTALSDPGYDATASAALATSRALNRPFSEWTGHELYEAWQTARAGQQWPETLVFAVLVESDETEPFREGSRDAGPIVKKLIDWLEGRAGNDLLVPESNEPSAGE